MIFLYIPETRGDSILLESGNLNETKLSQEPETPPTSILLFCGSQGGDPDHTAYGIKSISKT